MPGQQGSVDDRRQRALVTGATSGMGRAIAQQLARDGLEVIVHGRDAGRGAQVVEGIERAGGQASFAPADLGEPTGIEHLAAAAEEITGLVSFLASPRASYITGAVLAADGGRTAI